MLASTVGSPSRSAFSFSCCSCARASSSFSCFSTWSFRCPSFASAVSSICFSRASTSSFWRFTSFSYSCWSFFSAAIASTLFAAADFCAWWTRSSSRSASRPSWTAAAGGFTFAAASRNGGGGVLGGGEPSTSRKENEEAAELSFLCSCFSLDFPLLSSPPASSTFSSRSSALFVSLFFFAPSDFLFPSGAASATLFSSLFASFSSLEDEKGFILDKADIHIDFPLLCFSPSSVFLRAFSSSSLPPPPSPASLLAADVGSFSWSRFTVRSELAPPFTWSQYGICCVAKTWCTLSPPPDSDSDSRRNNRTRVFSVCSCCLVVPCCNCNADDVAPPATFASSLLLFSSCLASSLSRFSPFPFSLLSLRLSPFFPATSESLLFFFSSAARSAFIDSLLSGSVTSVAGCTRCLHTT
mmetsp:Transcript_22204/g.55985  ORF Transcript_22204/g.55985 Transcript_22204/m.55985 type:complete len:412 (-) Transcript_22204:72-1307(-)